VTDAGSIATLLVPEILAPNATGCQLVNRINKMHTKTLYLKDEKRST
jgi:hypothetical protein